MKAIELIACNLKSARDDGTDKKVRDKVALGSLFAGITITNSGTGGVHALAYPLGSIFGIPHGLANAMMLPYVSQFNMPACASRFAEVAKQMGIITKDLSIKETANEAVLAIRKLVEDMQISTRLRDVGIKRDDISALTKLAAKITRLLDNNPRRMEIADIERIYKDAF